MPDTPARPAAVPPLAIGAEIEARVSDLERRVDDVARELEERARAAREGLVDTPRPVSLPTASKPRSPDVRTRSEN
jgi:hypothetical protein